MHFIPISVCKEIKGQIGGAQADTYIRILAEEGATLNVFSNTLGFVRQRRREFARYLEPMIFIREAPFVPILAFILAIFGFVVNRDYIIICLFRRGSGVFSTVSLTFRASNLAKYE